MSNINRVHLLVIVTSDDFSWCRKYLKQAGVEGAALRPPRRVQEQSPCWGIWGQSPHLLKTNCILKALDCLKFVAKIKQVTFFPLITSILFNFFSIFDIF